MQLDKLDIISFDFGSEHHMDLIVVSDVEFSVHIAMLHDVTPKFIIIVFDFGFVHVQNMR